MTKKRSSRPNAKASATQGVAIRKQHLVIGAVALLLVVVVAAAFLFSPQGATNTQGVAVPDGGEVAPRAVSAVINPAAYQSELAEAEHVLIDVRTPQEFASGHIAGAINIPVEEIGQRLDEVPTGAPIVLYCRSGNRSAQAARILNRAGYTPVYDLGGVIEWQAAGLPLER